MDRRSQPMIDTQFAMTLELQLGLPSLEDLTPLNQSLITPELASVFGIMPTTRSTNFLKEPGSDFEPLKLFPMKSESEEGCRVRRRVDDSGSDEVESGSSYRAAKRPRLVWTSQLHKRFVDVIEQLGVDKAVPKTIMEMMNVEGLTRENVASHLQKYRLYLKKAEGIPAEANSSPISILSTSTRERSSTSSAFECGNGEFAPPMMPSGMHFDPLAMLPLPLPPMLGLAPAAFGYGGGLGIHLGVGPDASGSGKPGYCGMEFNASSMLWNRHRG